MEERVSSRKKRNWLFNVSRKRWQIIELQGDLHVVPALQWGPNMRKLVALVNKSIGQ